jgi:hypothetical protein
MITRPKGNQEILDFVLTHLREQQVPSVTTDGKCMYRGPNGTKCAVGCLIPDSSYHLMIENKGCQAPLIRNILAKIGYEPTEIYFIGTLQSIHDSWAKSRVAKDAWAKPTVAKAGIVWDAEQELVISKFAESQSLVISNGVKL